MSHNKYPEHEKLRKISDESQAIGEFLEWCHSRGWSLAEWEECGGYRRLDDRMVPVRGTIEDVLAQYFEIDQTALEEEKETMLEELRKANA